MSKVASASLRWETRIFEQLTNVELFEYFKLRQAVFIVEQTCPYPDIDDTDKLAHHLLAFNGDTLKACARIIPSNVTYEFPSIGRIAIAESGRGTGLGRELVERSIALTRSLFPNKTIKIGAQQYLEGFYQSFGFTTISEMYLEDNIPHIDMVLVPVQGA